jgi:hypothetical protein
MKVGEQGINRVKNMTGLDEEVGVSAEGLDSPSRGSRLESAYRGRPHSYNSTATISVSTQSRSSLGGNLSPFGVHHVISQVLHLDRPESADSNMQGDVDRLDSPGSEPPEQGLAEVKPGCWGRHRAVMSCIQGLVARPIFRCRSPLPYIRRQRRLTVSLEEGQSIKTTVGAILAERTHKPTSGLSLAFQD